MLYESKMDFTKSTVGKIVLTRDSSDTVTLFGKSASYDLSDKTPDQIARRLTQMAESPEHGLESMVGLHRDIDFNGQPIGGAAFAFNGETLYLFGISGEFGTIDDEEVRQCLPGVEVMRLSPANL